MTAVEEKLVLQALRRRRWNDRALFELMRVGPKLFDHLEGLLSSQELAGRERANALYVLLNLTREVCPTRKRDVMRIALVELMHSDTAVRDMAVRAVLHLQMMADHAGRRWDFAGREEIVTAIRAAVDAGLGRIEDQMARRWLASST